MALVKLFKNLGHSDNWIQNQKHISTFCKNVRRNGTVNIELPSNLIPYTKDRTYQFKLKLLLVPTNNVSSYCHTYSKTNAVLYEVDEHDNLN